MKIDPNAMLRGVQALLSQASQEDRKTGEVLEREGFERYLEAKETELEAKATQANCDYHVKNVEGAWGMIPVVGSGLGTMMTMGKDGREEYLRRIPGIGEWVADNETSLLVGALFVNAATAVPAAAILATDAAVPEASRHTAKEAGIVARDSEVDAEVLKKTVEDFADLKKRGGDEHRQVLESARAILNETAQATRTIFEK